MATWAWFNLKAGGIKGIIDDNLCMLYDILEIYVIRLANSTYHLLIFPRYKFLNLFLLNLLPIGQTETYDFLKLSICFKRILVKWPENSPCSGLTGLLNKMQEAIVYIKFND